METVTTFQKLTGQADLSTFLIFVFFAAIGVAVISLIGTKTRSKESERTPEHFSWKVFWADNVKRWVAAFLLIFLALRFTPELTGKTLTEWVAVLIGLGSDGIAFAIKKYSTLFDMKKTDSL